MSSGQARSRRELRAQKRGDQVVGRTSRLEEADGAGEDMRHALPFVHLDALPRSKPQGVVEKHLRCADMNLNAGRSGCGTIDGGRTWVPAVVVTEVLARAGLESGASSEALPSMLPPVRARSVHGENRTPQRAPGSLCRRDRARPPPAESPTTAMFRASCRAARPRYAATVSSSAAGNGSSGARR